MQNTGAWGTEQESENARIQVECLYVYSVGFFVTEARAIMLCMTGI